MLLKQLPLTMADVFEIFQHSRYDQIGLDWIGWIKVQRNFLLLVEPLLMAPVRTSQFRYAR